VTGRKFVVLADVDDAVRVGLRRVEQRKGPQRPPVGRPGSDATVELTGELLHPDLEGLPHDLVRVLVGIAHDDDQLGGVHEPAEPGGEGAAQLDRQRPRHVGSGELDEGAGVDDLGAGLHQPGYVLGAEGHQLGGAEQHPGSASVELAKPREVVRVGTEAVDQPPYEGVLVGSGEQRVAGLLLADRGGPGRARWGGAERSRTVGGQYRGRIVELADESVQRAILSPGKRLGVLGPGQVRASRGADDQ
jgi:hypothetical protein